MKVHTAEWKSDTDHGISLFMWCPGCDHLHGIEVEKESSKWGWDGDRESPTISPSILTHWHDADGDHRCHSFVRAGRWQFLDDCSHALKGQMVDMVDLPEWATK